MEQTNRIRIAVCVNSLSVNGISTMIMNSLEQIDHTAFDFTLLAGGPAAECYRAACRRLDVRLVRLPPRKTSPAAFYRALYRKLQRNRFDIFHIHGNSATMTVELSIAALCRIPVRIAHSHNTSCTCMKAHRLLSPLFPLVCTHRFACGKAAGKWLFRDRAFAVVPNGFRTERFRFQETYRREIRSRYHLEGKYILGHIGRFNSQKNHRFLLDVFCFAAEMREDAYLMLAGNGPDFSAVMEQIRNHPYRERILVLPETDMPEKLYSAMDAFVLPSLYEGLPVVLLEAQISGLPCFVSDTVTKELRLSPAVKYLSLEDSPGMWAREILREAPAAGQTDAACTAFSRQAFYGEHRRSLDSCDIRHSVKILEELYRSAAAGRPCNSCGYAGEGSL